MEHASIPVKKIGPIRMIGSHVQESVMVPLATYETPLWKSTQRGANVSRLTGGIRTTIIHEKMTRSTIFTSHRCCHRVSYCSTASLTHQGNTVCRHARQSIYTAH
jgi:hydroxymethylglutaryl-CoA reductase